MSVVAPLSDVAAVALPVLAGSRQQVLGLALTDVAIALVSLG